MLHDRLCGGGQIEIQVSLLRYARGEQVFNPALALGGVIFFAPPGGGPGNGAVLGETRDVGDGIEQERSAGVVHFSGGDVEREM